MFLEDIGGRTLPRGELLSLWLELAGKRVCRASAMVSLPEVLNNPEQRLAVAEQLSERGWAVDHFHGGMDPPDKTRVQDNFLRGDIPVIVATNAFGMGVDKPDVRVVEQILPRRILMICFNRAAAHELRTRLRDLVGEIAHGVAVHTYHSLALRLVGRSLASERSS